jgi:hypothetical protein
MEQTKLKRIVFEETGETRVAVSGDYYLTESGSIMYVSPGCFTQDQYDIYRLVEE